MISRNKIKTLSQFNKEVFGVEDTEAFLGQNLINKEVAKGPYRIPLAKQQNEPIDYDRLADKVASKIAPPKPQEQSGLIQKFDTTELLSSIKNEIQSSMSKIAPSGTINTQAGKIILDTPNIVLTGKSDLVTTGQIGEEQSSKISMSDLDMLFDMANGK